MSALRALLLALLLGPAPAAAQQPAPLVAQPPRGPAPVMPSPIPAKVELGVMIVRATNDAPRVDPRLASWGRHLERMPFQRYDLVGEHRFRVPDGGREEVVLPDGHVLTLTLASHDTSTARVVLSSRRAGTEPVETVLTVHRDRAFMYVLRTGRPDAALLLRVDVRY